MKVSIAHSVQLRDAGSGWNLPPGQTVQGKGWARLENLPAAQTVQSACVEVFETLPGLQAVQFARSCGLMTP